MPDPRLFIVKGQKCPMIPVEGGSFKMGSPDDDSEGYADERPQHPVTVPDFYIGKYLVTQALWKAVMDGENPSHFTGDDRPVETVSWSNVQHFLQELNTLTADNRPAGHAYRLPTEAEWRYAARGGKYQAEGYTYAGSDRLKDVGWFSENSGEETKPVGLKYPNQLDIHDMSGNVWEWCADDWHDKYNDQSPTDGSAWIGHPDRGSFRVLRGGGWLNYARNCRIADRNNYGLNYSVNYVGFRLVLACI